MKLTINSSRLSKALAKCMPAISNNIALPICGDFLFSLTGSELHISATDTTLYITTIVLPDTIDIEGTATCQAASLNNLMKTLPDQPITLEIKDGGMHIQSNNGSYTLPTGDPEDFPQPTIDPLEKKDYWLVKKEQFVELVNATTFASSNDMLRLAMAGVNLIFHEEKLTGVATNAHCLSEYVIGQLDKYKNDEKEYHFNCTKESLAAAAQLHGEDIHIYGNHNSIVIYDDQTRIYSTLIDRRFVDYRRIMPTSHSKTATVDRSELLSSIKRVSALSNQTSNSISLSFSEGGIEVAGADDMHGRSGAERISHTSYTGDDIMIHFDFKLAISTISRISAPEIMINMNEPNNPMVAIPHTTGNSIAHTCLIMPQMPQ